MNREVRVTTDRPVNTTVVGKVMNLQQKTRAHYWRAGERQRDPKAAENHGWAGLALGG